MKKLQNNFTTPEQSKRLLELGVPSWSADCYLLHNEVTNEYDKVIVINDQDDFNFIDKNSIPCWSIDRLIEIILKCYISCYEIKFSTAEYYTCTLSNTNIIIMKIEHLIKYNDLDFSKLD